MPEKMASSKYRVRLIFASKHGTMMVKQKGIGGYSPRQSVQVSQGKLLSSNASEKGAPLHYKNTGVVV